MALFGFIFLQLLDAATTLIFLKRGVGEANPLIRIGIEVFGGPIAALVAAKLAGVLLALYAWRTERISLLRRLNLFFAACFVWNCAAILMHP